MHFERLDDGSGGIRVHAPAKVNLYLEVGPLCLQGPDAGFHPIDSLFQSITLFDSIDLWRADAGVLSLQEVGIEEARKNLVYRAAALLLSSPLCHGRRDLGVRMRLLKRIPEGAGLGGGSSDAAATLVALSILWGLEVSVRDLAPLALELGSDVPFFLRGGTARCQGRGELITDLTPAFATGEPFHYVLAYPRCKAPTGLVYRALDASRGPEYALTASSPLDSMPPVLLREQLGFGNVFFNRFEAVVFDAFPEVASIHAELSREPFVKVLMSGSGSTVFGVCRTGPEAESLAARLRAHLPADFYVAQSERSTPTPEFSIPD